MSMGVGAIRIDRLAGLSTVIGSFPASLQTMSTRLRSVPLVRLDASHLDPEVDPTEMLDHLDTTPREVVLPVTGPITVGVDLGRNGLGNDDAAALAVAAVDRVAHRLVAAARRRVPDATTIVFLEEPALVNSMHPTFPLGSALVEAMLGELVSRLSGNSLVGLRVPGRADWAMLLGTGIDALAAPVTAHLETAAVEIRRFLESGGIMVWGAVPVDEPLGVSPERLWRRLVLLWGELIRGGLDPALLRERSIIAPAAELGSFGVSQAERVLNLSQDLASRLMRYGSAVRLSIGA